MILDDVIAEVRRIIQDETATFRYSDVFLLSISNQALQRIQLLRPDLFAKSGTLTCTQGAVLQSAPSDSLRIIEIFSVVGGNAVVEASREVLDRTVPNWVASSEAAAINWMRHVRSPNEFFIYPNAPAAQTLNLTYSQVPPTYGGTTAVAILPDAFFPVVVDIVVFLVESVDNENVSNGRAKLFQDSYLQMLGRTVQNRAVTDTENAGEEISPKVLEVV